MATEYVRHTGENVTELDKALIESRKDARKIVVQQVNKMLANYEADDLISEVFDS